MRSTAFRMLRVSIPFLLGAVAAPVAAQSLPISAPLPITIASADTTKVYRFEIPSRPVAAALTDFARQTGLRVDLVDSTAPDARSTAVAGMYTAPAALRVLLTGTSLAALFVDPETIVVRRITEGAVAQAMTPVVVSADASRRTRYATRRTTTATRTDAPLRDVPQAITVVGADLIADQSMQNMADVVRYVPGVSMGQGEGHRDAPTIRGQESTADFYADGMRDDAQYLRDLYNVERVEALKGPNAMIFGRGGGGGVINRVTKEAQWMPTRSLTLEGGSFEHRRATFDLGDGLGRSAAARVNAMIEDSRHFRHATELERYGVTPTATFLLGNILAKVSYEYFADRRTVNRGIPSFEGAPVRTDIATFFGDPNASRSRLVMHGGTATIDRAWGGLTLRNRTRLVRYDKFYQNVFGDGVAASGTEVTLRAYNNSTDRRSLFNQTDVTYALGTGSVRQTILVGAEMSRQRSDNYRNTGYFNGTTTSMAVPLDAPTVSPAVEYRQGGTEANNRVDANVAAVYLQNQIALGPRWQAIVGVRYDHFDLDAHDNRTGSDLGRSDEMISPRAGLVFKPAEPVSLYGSYSVSHLPSAGDQFASLTPTTRALEPEGFRNRELGVKWDIRPDLSLSGAWYRLDRTNTVAPDPTSSTRLVQTGRQRSTGHEISLSGSVTPEWQIAAGYAAQKATIVSRTSAAAPGAMVPLVPRQTLSLWNRIQLVPRLGAGVGVIYQSKMFAAIDNTVPLPGFTRVDAAAFVTLTPTVRAQLNVENALDERYFPTSHGNNNIAPGAPRTLRFSLTLAP
ncbi:MAG TPA: TonB-dependent siderophore receptor [Gemmatimonadaceae bacterium]|nr:TonB-dependent siderophore receptor [Gemmatimonadaceae bacterium]